MKWGSGNAGKWSIWWVVLSGGGSLGIWGAEIVYKMAIWCLIILMFLLKSRRDVRVKQEIYTLPILKSFALRRLLSAAAVCANQDISRPAASETVLD